MKYNLRNLVLAAWDSVRDPRAGARQVMALSLPRQNQWEALFLIVVLSVLLTQVTLLLTGNSGGIIVGGPGLSAPVALGLMQFVMLVVMIFAIFLLGRRAGGTGSFGDTIMLVTWLQFILICLQVVQTFAFLVVPVVGNLIGLAGFALFFWLLANFVAELHGFSSPRRVFVSILIAMVGFAILLSVVLSFLGVEVAGA
ncbi:MAG: YIP1 family protein [Marinosulfonomonas sp.]|nr:YIP1 family protein [Marinosulfonomonas sp.]